MIIQHKGKSHHVRAGDVLEFEYRGERRTAAVLRYLTFPQHVVVHFGNNGHVVDAGNFLRLVRRGRGSEMNLVTEGIL